MFIDTHCHLEMLIQYPIISSFSSKDYQIVENIVKNAHNKNVTSCITIGTTYQRCLQALDLAQKFHAVHATVGIHPCDITPTWRQELKSLKILLQNHQENKIVGIGETGLDFYHPGYNVEEQKTVFREQIELALEFNLALVVHTRNAIDETLTILQEYKHTNLRGVIHCFSENLEIAYDIQKCNFMIGIGAIITYPKNGYLRDVITTLACHNIVLETDSPFLSPQSMRGKQNTPENVALIGHYYADLLGWPVEKVADATTANAKKLFGV